MANDTIRKDAPAAEKELQVLKTLKVGEVRQSTLFPVLGDEIAWVLTSRKDDQWVFDGQFCGVSFIAVVITEDAEFLSMNVQKEVGV